MLLFDRLRPERPRLALLCSAMAFVAIALYALNYHWQGGGGRSDSRADWLTATAAVDGLNPYDDVWELADTYSITVDITKRPSVHPRPPSALLLTAPAAWLHPEAFRLVVLSISLVALAAIVYRLLPSLSHIPAHVIWLLAPLVIASYPVYSALEYASQSIIVSGLILWSWHSLRGQTTRCDVQVGIALGLASALKLWPLILVVGVWFVGRRRAALISGLVVLLLNVAGMLALDLEVGTFVSGLSMASEIWLPATGNGSLAGWFNRSGVTGSILVPALVIAGLGVTILVARRDPERTIPTAIIVGLLVSPLSWEHYDMVLFGITAWSLGRSTWPRRLALSWLTLSLMGMLLRLPLLVGLELIGVRTLVGRLLVAAAVGVVIVSEARVTRHVPLRSEKGAFEASAELA